MIEADTKYSIVLAHMNQATDSPEPWLVIGDPGGLKLFDRSACLRLAAEFDTGTRDESHAWAKACIALLDEAAKHVDFIQREGGGTYGDAIRNLNITETPHGH